METIRQLESEIEHDLMHGGQTPDAIEAKFNNIKTTLDKVDKTGTEYEEMSMYYHAIYAAYLRSLGKHDQAAEEDKLAGKYASIQGQEPPQATPIPQSSDANPDSTSKAIGMPIAKPDTIRVYQETAAYLNYIQEKIKFIADKTEKAILHKELATFYLKQANRAMMKTFMDSVPYWQYARNHFMDSLKYNDKDADCVIGYAKCLIKLGKYNDALKHLKDTKFKPEVTNRVDYCHVRANALRHRFEYTEAEKYLVKALETDQGNNDVKNDLELVRSLIKNKTEERLQGFRQSQFETSHEFYTKRNEESMETYRILSVDGGGIRGIIPAYWLCEIEKRAHKPISHLFNLLAGTSTGGIIAAGLSVPKNDDGFTPLYSATDILEIYLKRGSDIFTKRNFFGKPFFGSTYSDDGRLKVLTEFFGNKKLETSLTNLVIPACNEENLISTYLFNRYDACIDPFMNDTYVDALMATSAAPTYFPTYRIQGKGLFNDGGVHVNNPSAMACSEALRYGIPSNKLYMLSLGTGGCIPDPLDAGTKRTILFWASHLQDVALQAQVGNADIAVSNALGKNYKRWQAWLEEPIALDDFKQDSLKTLMECANEYIEKLDYSEENTINKLVEFLVKE